MKDDLNKPVLREMTMQDVLPIAKMAQKIMPFPWKLKVFLTCFTDQYHNWILEIDNVIVGFVIIQIAYDECLIMNIGVDKKYQRQHWGQYLMRQVLQQPAEKFWLEVRESNKAAIAMYSSLGFVEVGRRKKYYPGRFKREDAVVMRLVKEIE